MAMKKIMVSMSKDMVEALEKERKRRKLETIPEVVRLIISDYFASKQST